MFATAFYMVVDVSSGAIRYATAGHPAPYRLRRSNGEIDLLHVSEGAREAAPGLFEDSTYRSDESRLEPGDLLLLYTDGLPEAHRADSDDDETVRMDAKLREHLQSPPEVLLRALVEDARDFLGTQAFEDDVCLLAVELDRLVDAPPNVPSE